MVDLLRVVITADTSGSDKATESLEGMTNAARRADAATNDLSVDTARNAGVAGQAAASVEKQTVVSRAHTAALQAEAAASRMAMHNRTNLAYQLQDIGVSLAGGQNPILVMTQQLPQMMMGFSSVGAMLRSLIGLFGSLAVAAGPWLVVLGAAVGLLAGITREINKTAETQVSFFDVALAGWQLFAEGVTNIVQPVFGAIGGWLVAGWDTAWPVLKAIGNNLIATFVGAFNAIKDTWALLPAAIGDIAIQAANGVLSAIHDMIQEAITSANSLIRGVNKVAKDAGLDLNLGTIDRRDFYLHPIANPFEGKAAATGTAAQDAINGAFSTDYIGGGLDAWGERAQAIANAGDAVDKLGNAAGAAGKKMKDFVRNGLEETAKKAREMAESIKGIFSGIGSSVFGAMRDGTDAATALLNNFLDNLYNAAGTALDSGIQSLIQTGISAIMGGGVPGTASQVGDYVTQAASSTLGTSGWRSFDGGGHTGFGARIGGIDGRGGFPAILHPNETVNDNTRPSANQNRPINHQTNIVNNAGVQVTEQTVDDGQGGYRQDIVIDRMVASVAGKPRSRTQRAMRASGVRPQR